jgi:hypothetical protein
VIVCCSEINGAVVRLPRHASRAAGEVLFIQKEIANAQLGRTIFVNGLF